MKDWQSLVQMIGDAATNDYATITDLIDLDDCYRIEVFGYTGDDALRARTRKGVDDTLKEFNIPSTSWRKL